MLIDLVLLGFVVNAPGWLFAILTAFVLFRATSTASGARRGVGRFFLRVFGALIAFIGVLSLLGALGGLVDRVTRGDPDTPALTADGGSDEDARPTPLDGDGLGEAAEGPSPEAEGVLENGAATTGADGEGLVFRGRDVVGHLISLGRAGDSAQARPHAAALARYLAAEGQRIEGVEGLRSALEDVSELPFVRFNEETLAVVEDEFRRAGVLVAAPSTGPPAVAAVDSLLTLRAAAVAEGRSEDAERLLSEAGLLAASDTIGRLRARITGLRSDVEEAEDRAEEAEEAAQRSPIGLLLDLLADEIGVSAGWAALYFTAMLALWRGRTPGKRALGIRVIRLNGEPLGWFASFERFGGYAAALATGTLGFFQILWDRNRQGVHDKISETVVIRDLPPTHVTRRPVTTR